jgi:hypothetical protein
MEQGPGNPETQTRSPVRTEEVLGSHYASGRQGQNWDTDQLPEAV